MQHDFGKVLCFYKVTTLEALKKLLLVYLRPWYDYARMDERLSDPLRREEKIRRDFRSVEHIIACAKAEGKDVGDLLKGRDAIAEWIVQLVLAKEYQRMTSISRRKLARKIGDDIVDLWRLAYHKLSA